MLPLRCKITSQVTDCHIPAPSGAFTLTETTYDDIQAARVIGRNLVTFHHNY
jgi:hypothetical protein